MLSALLSAVRFWVVDWRAAEIERTHAVYRGGRGHLAVFATCLSRALAPFPHLLFAFGLDLSSRPFFFSLWACCFSYFHPAALKRLTFDCPLLYYGDGGGCRNRQLDPKWDRARAGPRAGKEPARTPAAAGGEQTAPLFALSQ